MNTFACVIFRCREDGLPRRARGLTVASCLLWCAAGTASVVMGQEDGRFSNWTKVESAAETRAFCRSSTFS